MLELRQPTALGPWPENETETQEGDRQWQKEAFSDYIQRTRTNFLTVATPGAGKTRHALRVAHAALYSGEAERIVIICPTVQLRKQWADKAKGFGIQFDPKWENELKKENGGYHGLAVTYGTVVSDAGLHRRLSYERPTLVIFDEPHHMANNRSWGVAVKQAFGHERVTARLLLSGTPFRSDNEEIPFATYDNGICIPNYTYSYGRAIHDRVCRNLVFNSFDGEMEYYMADKIIRTTLANKASEKETEGLIWRRFLDPREDWLRTVFREGDDWLSELQRHGHPNAGGLVLAVDRDHARKIADMIYGITHKRPVVVISDDPREDADDPHKLIDQFEHSEDRWIVAVKMVSEGVDIPRLRVLIYATTTISPLFFRQAMGRVVRYDKTVDCDYAQQSYVYLPDVPILKAHAQQIKEEIAHELELELEELRQEQARFDDIRAKPEKPLLTVISAHAVASDVIVDGLVLPQAEILPLAPIAQDAGLSVDIVARVLRSAQKMQHPLAPPAPPSAVISRPNTVELARYELDQRYRDAIARLSTQLMGASRGALDKRTINTRLKEFSNWTERRKLTTDQLKAQVDFLETWLTEVRNERG